MLICIYSNVLYEQWHLLEKLKFEIISNYQLQSSEFLSDVRQHKFDLVWCCISLLYIFSFLGKL